jgi:hypothetical protein
MQEKPRRILAIACAMLMTFSLVPAVLAGGGGAHIWLNADPGERAKGGGWKAGGWVTYCDFGPDVVCDFELIVENRGNDDLTDLRIAMAIHNWTTSDDFASIDVEGETSYLPDFGNTEENPFDEGWGGNHHVYSGDEAIWDIYFYEPEVLPGKTTVRLDVTVTLGPDPDDYFEIHFDAFDPVDDYKTPNGHDLTFISSAMLPDDEEPPECSFVPLPSDVVAEGELVTLDASGSYDPDGDIVSFIWDIDVDFDSDGDGIYDNDVDLTGEVVTFIWYDNDYATVKLTCVDDDGLIDVAYGDIEIYNVDPTATIEGAYIEANLFLRVAGEKWHNVELTLYENYDRETGQYDDVAAFIEVERWPGDPDLNPSDGDQGLTIRLDVGGSINYTAVVTYDPYEDIGDAIMGDQPINGQLWGANPVWIVLDFTEGGQCKIHHTFNVQQSLERDSEHFIHVEPWIVDIEVGALVGAPLTFVGTATDPGTDDLTFTWDWGDGSNVTTTTYYYDPARVPPEDPYPSPYEPYYGGTTPPLTVQDTQTHAYGAPGTYVVTLTVTDDDGGTTTVTTTITVGEDDICPKGGGGGRGANQGELALLQITAWEYNIDSGTVGPDDVVTFPDGTQMTASEGLDHLMSLYDNGEYETAIEIADHLNNEYGHTIGYWGLSPGHR